MTFYEFIFLIYIIDSITDVPFLLRCISFRYIPLCPISMCIAIYILHIYMYGYTYMYMYICMVN